MNDDLTDRLRQRVAETDDDLDGTTIVLDETEVMETEELRQLSIPDDPDLEDDESE